MAVTEEFDGTLGPVLRTVGDSVTLSIAHPGPVLELFVAVVLLVMVIGVHGWCVGSISKFFGAHISKVTHATEHWRVTMLTAVTVALLAITHLVETLIWTVPIYWLGLIPNLRDAYYFVLQAYTTLGEGTVTLPDSWRLIAPVIAISGLFTFGWTGSVLVYIVTETTRRRAIGLHADPQQHIDHSAAAPKAETPKAGDGSD